MRLSLGQPGGFECLLWISIRPEVNDPSVSKRRASSGRRRLCLKDFQAKCPGDVAGAAWQPMKAWCVASFAFRVRDLGSRQRRWRPSIECGTAANPRS